MERLTTRCSGYAVMAWEHEEKHTTQEWIDMLTDRLAAYEDTGLTPEEIADFMKRWERAVEISGLCKKGGIDHLLELKKADQDGRLLVLPCKVGDTVFDIGDGTSYATRVLNFSYFGDHWACRTVSSYPDLEQFGTRIFLTREEAEAAMAQEGGKDHA